MGKSAITLLVASANLGCDRLACTPLGRMERTQLEATLSYKSFEPLGEKVLARMGWPNDPALQSWRFGGLSRFASHAKFQSQQPPEPALRQAPFPAWQKLAQARRSPFPKPLTCAITLRQQPSADRAHSNQAITRILNPRFPPLPIPHTNQGSQTLLSKPQSHSVITVPSKIDQHDCNGRVCDPDH